MGKIFVILLILGVIWVGMTIYNEGTGNAFGGIFAPLESARDDDGTGATALTPAAQQADVPSQPTTRPAPITDRVREGVTRDIEEGTRRRGY